MNIFQALTAATVASGLTLTAAGTGYAGAIVMGYAFPPIFEPQLLDDRLLVGGAVVLLSVGAGAGLIQFQQWILSFFVSFKLTKLRNLHAEIADVAGTDRADEWLAKRVRELEGE